MISHNEIFHTNESQQNDNDSTVKYAVQKSSARDFYNHSHCLCIQLFVHLPWVPEAILAHAIECLRRSLIGLRPTSAGLRPASHEVVPRENLWYPGYCSPCCEFFFPTRSILFRKMKIGHYCSAKNSMVLYPTLTRRVASKLLKLSSEREIVTRQRLLPHLLFFFNIFSNPVKIPKISKGVCSEIAEFIYLFL